MRVLKEVLLFQSLQEEREVSLCSLQVAATAAPSLQILVLDKLYILKIESKG